MEARSIESIVFFNNGANISFLRRSPLFSSLKLLTVTYKLILKDGKPQHPIAVKYTKLLIQSRAVDKNYSKAMSSAKNAQP